MKIVMTGGGSGGHITPILAVAHEIKRLQPSAEIIYMGKKGDPLIDIPSEDPNISAVYSVSAGKLRRYSGEGWRQLLDVRTQAMNIRDVVRTARGVWESWRLIRRLKPDVLFTRGGFVSVPVAIGAKLYGVPYITHDSDGTPSLANRLIARWAVLHAVTMPVDFYPYPSFKTRQLGVPVSSQFVSVNPSMVQDYRQELGLSTYSHMVLVTGGGNGAQALNYVVIQNAAYLLSRFPGLVIVHVAGRALVHETIAAYDGLGLHGARQRVIVKDFVRDMYRYSGAADVIIARGGATNIAEFAIQRKACFIIPPPQLPWNVKDAQALAERKAIVSLSQAQAEQSERLGRAVEALLKDAAKRQQLGNTLGQLARPHAAEQLAKVLLAIPTQGGDVSV